MSTFRFFLAAISFRLSRFRVVAILLTNCVFFVVALLPFGTFLRFAAFDFLVFLLRDDFGFVMAVNTIMCVCVFFWYPLQNHQWA